MRKAKVLITGASGMLGSRIFKLLKSNTNYQVVGIGRASDGQEGHIACDITDIPAFIKVMKELSPDYVVHCAANVNLESCEKEKEYTYKLHVVTSRVIAAMESVKKSIFISTDSVFNGLTGNYKEDNFVHPLNYYALTKALAEESFLNARHPSVVVRTNMFGFNNPVRKSLFEWAWTNLRDNIGISGYSNVYFNPLYVETIAKIVGQLLENDLTGLLHIGCAEGISKYDFISKIADLFAFSPALVKSAVADNNGPIQRPMNTILNTEQTQQRIGITMPDIGTELSELFNDFKEIKQLIKHD